MNTLCKFFNLPNMSKKDDCFCNIDPAIFQEKPGKWDQILEKPFLEKIKLVGNDGPQFILTLNVLLFFLGHTFEPLIEGPEIHLDEPFAVVKALHDYSRNGKCEFNDENVTPIMMAAKRFRIGPIRHLAGQYLMTKLEPNTALQILKQTSELLCVHFRIKVKKFILTSFQKICQLPQFLNECSCELMKEFIVSHRLNIDEKELLVAIVRWFSMSQENMNHIKRIMPFLKYHCLPKNILKLVAHSDSVLYHSLECDTQTKEEIRVTLLRVMGKYLERKPSKTYRIPSNVLLSLGGFEESPCARINSYDSRMKAWRILNTLNMMRPTAYHGVALLGSKLYVIGGYGQNEYYRKTFCLNLKTRDWTEKASMKKARCYVSVVELNGLIFAMGGFNGNVRTACVECYNPVENQWTSVTNMNLIRSDGSAVAFDNKIMVLGGFDGISVHQSTEIYDINTNTWTFGPRMISQRSGFSTVLFNHKLYAIGGFNGHTRLQTVECLDMRSPFWEWQLHSELSKPRSNFGAAVFEEKIFIAGGYDGQTVIDDVEVFSEETKKWNSAEEMIPIAKSALTLKTLPNLEKPLNFLARP